MRTAREQELHEAIQKLREANRRLQDRLTVVTYQRDDLAALYVHDPYCGKLGGGPQDRRLHKHECPIRTRCQSHPEGCPS